MKQDANSIEYLGDCLICADLRCDPSNSFIYSKFGERICKDMIIMSCDNFFAFPGPGQIKEGYVIISPYLHIQSFGKILPDYIEELEDFIYGVTSVITQMYSSPIIFEHGSLSPVQKGAGCIDHAHIHVMPYNGLEKTEELLFSNHKCIKLSGIVELIEIVKHNVPYVYFELPDSSKYYFNASNCSSQLMRKYLAIANETPEEWDWKINVYEDRFIKTLYKFKNLNDVQI